MSGEIGQSRVCFTAVEMTVLRTGIAREGLAVELPTLPLLGFCNNGVTLQIREVLIMFPV